MLLQFLDTTIIVGVLWVTAEFFYTWEAHYLAAAMLVAALYLILATQAGVYRRPAGEGFASGASALLQAWGLVIAIAVLTAFVTKTSERYSRAAVLCWFVLCPIAMALLRILIARLNHAFRSRVPPRRAVIAGASGPGPELARTLLEQRSLGIALQGFYDDDNQGSSELPAPHLGDYAQLVFDARSGAYDYVFLTASMPSAEHLRRLVIDLADCNVELRYIPDIFTLNLLHSRFSDVGGMPCINVFESPLNGAGSVIKRIEDLVLGSLIVIITAIPMLLIGLAIKLNSPGPILFTQRRYGYRGEPIVIWKFRTMTVCESGEQAVQATRDDARVTPLGAFLRRTSLDELPQFFNVLAGTMSIVGPRPHPIALDEKFRSDIEGYMLRNRVKPGITGWAQVNGWRGETDTLEKMQQRVQHDLHYIRNWSVWFDVKIILITILRVLTDRNAY